MVGAQQLYESCGFQRERELPSKYGLRYWRYTLPFKDSDTHGAKKEEI